MQKIKLLILPLAILSGLAEARPQCVSPDGDYPNGPATLQSEIDEGECSPETGGGVATTQDAILTANKVSTTFNFQFNRPTSLIADALRQMRHSWNAAGVKPASPSTGGASGADTYKIDGDMGLLFGAGGNFGSTDSRAGTSGYNHYGRNANLGFDYRFNDMLTSGVFFNYTSLAADMPRGGGSFGGNIYRFAPFLSLTPFENFYVDMSIGYGYHDNTSSRPCAGCVGYLNADYSSQEVFTHLGFGYTHNMDAWNLTGYGQVSQISLFRGSYQETGGVDVYRNGVSVSHQDYLSLATTLGTELTYTVSTAYGVLVPRIFAEWMHEYKNNSQVAPISIVDVPPGQPDIFAMIPLSMARESAPFRSASPIRNWGNVGIGTQLVLPNSLSTFVNYKTLFMEGSSNHTVEGGIRWQF